jgi:hypothetical protein
MERRFGPITDATVRAKCLLVDDASRRQVLGHVAEALDQAAAQLRNYADGDYSPDPKANRFPAFVTEQQVKAAELTITGLFEAWQQDAIRLNRSEATVSRYRSVLTNLTAFIEHDEATDQDIIRFKDARLADGVCGKRVKDGDTAALKSVFDWAVENKRLPSNPAAEVVICVAKRKVERERATSIRKRRNS